MPWYDVHVRVDVQSYDELAGITGVEKFGVEFSYREPSDGPPEVMRQVATRVSAKIGALLPESQATESRHASTESVGTHPAIRA